MEETEKGRRKEHPEEDTPAYPIEREVTKMLDIKNSEE